MPVDSYAREKLGLAVLELARGEKRRVLRRVATSTLCAVWPTDFPDELRPSWEEIWRRLTSRGKIDETVDGMTEQEAAEVALMLEELNGRSKRAP